MGIADAGEPARQQHVFGYGPYPLGRGSHPRWHRRRRGRELQAGGAPAPAHGCLRPWYPLPPLRLTQRLQMCMGGSFWSIWGRSAPGGGESGPAVECAKSRLSNLRPWLPISNRNAHQEGWFEVKQFKCPMISYSDTVTLLGASRQAEGRWGFPRRLHTSAR